MRVYICIPLAYGDDEVNAANIESIRRDLEAIGHEVVSPINNAKGYPSRMAKCIEDLLSCKAIYAAGDWKKCKRCSIEYYIAKAHDMKVLFGPERINSLKPYIVQHVKDNKEYK